MIMGEDEAFLFSSLIFWWGGKSEQYTQCIKSYSFLFSVAGSVGHVLEPLTPSSKVPAGDMEATSVFKKGVSAGS